MMEETREPRRTRRGGGWIWGLVGLIVLALLVWWMWPDSDDEFADADIAAELEPVTPVGPVVGTEGTGSIAAILREPQRYIGQEFPAGEARVAEVVTDRGFWIVDAAAGQPGAAESGAQQTNRLFALIIDEPRERPVNIQAGQTLRIDGGTLRDRSHLSELAGVPIDDDTRGIVEQQQVFLVVDEDDLTVTSVQQGQSANDPLAN